MYTDIPEAELDIREDNISIGVFMELLFSVGLLETRATVSGKGETEVFSAPIAGACGYVFSEFCG